MIRKLAAVLAADVVDYSRLMGADSEGTLASLRRLRKELFRPTVAGYRGRVVKSMGDGWIVTFSSTAEAVNCAMRLQDRLVDEQNIQIRVGIHLGDVTVEEEDVFGDGVNVAARLEALCHPGGVTISDAVFVTLDGTLRPAFDDSGEHSLKNIEQPMRVWTRGGVAGAMAIKERQGKDGFPKLIIQPAETSSDQDDVRELSEALTHDLSTYLGATRWLQSSVSTRRSNEACHLLARLRTASNRLRIECRLISPNGDVIWSGKFDGDLDSLFELQDEAGSKIAAQVLAAITKTVLSDIEQKSEEKRSWEDWVVLAAAGYSPNHQKLERGLQFIEKALSLSPDSTYPYELALNGLASASMLGFLDIVQTYAPKSETWWQGVQQTDKAGFDTRVMSAVVRYNQEGNISETRKEIDAFLRDLPYDPEALIQAGFTFLFMGDTDRALDCFRKFETVGRHHPYHCLALQGIGSVYLIENDAERSLPFFDAAIRHEPGFPAPYRWKAAALALLKREEEAKQTMALGLNLTPGLTVATVRSGTRYADTPGIRKVLDCFRLAGMPEK